MRGDFRPFDRQMSRFAVTSRSRFSKVGKGIGLGLVAGLGVAGFAAKKAFSEFQQAEKATRQTRAALKSTGAVAGVTAKQIEQLANAISLKAGIDDEAIQSSENLLLTFTRVRNGIGKDNKIFNQATQAITDMAAAMAAGSGGTPDLKGATIQVGKALQDPIKGITALRRVGVNFDQQQSDRIKRWVEEGKQIKAQKFILRELRREFGGSAAANATSTEKLKVAIANLEESIGRTFGPLVERVAGKLAKFINQMQSGEGAGGRFAKKMKRIGEDLLPVIKAVGRVGKAVGEFVGNHPQLAAMATSAALFTAAFKKFKIDKGLAGLLALFRGGKGLAGGGGILGGLTKKTPVPVFVTNPGFGGVGGKGPGGILGKVGRTAAGGAEGAGVSGAAGAAAGGGATAAGLGAVGVGALGVGIIAAVALKVNKNLETRGTAAAQRAEKGALGSVGGQKGGVIGVSGGDIARQREEINRSRKDTKQWATDTERSGNRIKNSIRDLQSGYSKTRQRTDQLTARTSSLAGSFDVGAKKGTRLGRSLRDTGFNAFGAGQKVGDLASKIGGLPSEKTVKISVFTKFLRQATKGIGSLFRKGGLAMRGGGMVPAMLSPGEVGVTPDGGRFKVPGSRIAADTVPSLVPSGTAILTASGQRMERQGRPLGDIIRNQLPHFREGGLAGATRAAGAIKAAGLRRLERLVTMVATAGRESRWNPRATNRNTNGTMDWGPWQINDIWRSNPKAQRLWSRRLSFDGGARLAKIVLDEQGLSAWRLPGWQGDSTIAPFRSTAARAVAAVQRGGSKLNRITPAPISHPILSTQLRPLIDDALLGGIQAGMDRTGHAGRVDLLQQILEGIVPESTDRATRERVSLSGRSGGGGASGPVAARIQKMQKWGDSVSAKHMPYQYGGGHGRIGVGSPSFDCSGFVSGILHAGGLLDTPLTTVSLAGWGLGGKGRNVTVGVRGGAGRAGHTMMQVGNKFYESGGSSGGPTRRSSWDGTFTTWRHPGWRKGGMVGLPPSPEGRKHLERLAQRKHTTISDLLDPRSKNFVGFGLRTGGMVGPNFDFDAWLRKFKRRHHRQPSLIEITNLLGADQLGTRNADAATRVLARRVQGRSTGALVRTQNRIRAQIKRMARHGFTGPERIRTRRLRGALSLVQDELGRPIGRALGGSDRLQELIDRRSRTLPDRLTLLGVDPESNQGLKVQQDEAKNALFRLTARRAELQKALTRARKAKNPAAVKAVKQEISDVDEEILGLRASIINLDKSMKENTASVQDDIRQAQLEALQRIAELQKESNDRQKRIELAVNSQGPALETLLASLLDGGIGGKSGLGRSFPSFAGLGGLART